MTNAIVLAAGQGTRLRPLTDERPKCLVPLQGRSLLDLQCETLRDCGVSDITVAAGYRADDIARAGYETVLNDRFASTNMVVSLFSAKEAMRPGDDLIIGYGDIVYQRSNLRELLKSQGEIALMIDRRWRDLWSLRLDDPLSDAETLVLDGDGHVLELGKKPESYDRIHGQYTGLIKVRGDKVADFIAFFEGLDRDARYDGKSFDNMYMTSFLQALIDTGWRVDSALVDRGWLEVDSVEDLETYERMARDGTLQDFFDRTA